MKLIDMTEESKTGEAQSQQFEKMIDDVESEYGAKVTHFVTDGDGGSSKGRKLLVKKRPHLLAPECWGHQVACLLLDIMVANFKYRAS